jgi:hypothetical protein
MWVTHGNFVTVPEITITEIFNKLQNIELILVLILFLFAVHIGLSEKYWRDTQ